MQLSPCQMNNDLLFPHIPSDRAPNIARAPPFLQQPPVDLRFRGDPRGSRRENHPLSPTLFPSIRYEGRRERKLPPSDPPTCLSNTHNKSPPLSPADTSTHAGSLSVDAACDKLRLSSASYCM
ncbi:hypothetical protein BJY00DRAFT_175957 [Aspergillus carlsbadensis]|nr:hypothetical protein BJY00DRAFT_175957 [Aspergillus carlsbadensis]